ncbi:tetratricopeptide repeat protein [Pseudodesulfovibrio tunisiensis]|uniref:tetratricopeptide repeat protein n=1 Tax=Pseudodesulfovibrio tunisiensis TaxID=463192 RepID=UPI001FB28E3B|nr:tetratricopeptide repeat protein [Pseudodesulfovibrio tunisiensis]
MNVRHWQVLCFVAAVITASLLAFPFRRDLIQLYLDSGDITTAASVMEEVLHDDPDNYALLLQAAKINFMLGRPDQAITALEKALRQKPHNLNALRTLAQYREWNVQPMQAANVYERIAEVRPTAEIYRKLVGFYRYFGEREKEYRAIARLIGMTAEEKTEGAPRFIRALAPDLNRLAALELDDESTPYQDFLMQRLFILDERYRLETQEPSGPDVEQFAIWAGELYMATDNLDMGRAFATRLDTARGGATARLALASVLRWNGRYADALPLLTEIRAEQPDNLEVIQTLAQVGRDAGNYEVAAGALEDLSERDPGNSQIRRDLISVYMEGGMFERAVAVLRTFMNTMADAAQYLHAFLNAALFSGSREALEAAAEQSERFDITDPAMLRTRGEIYLALEQAGDAYPLLREVAVKRDGRPDDLSLLIDAAGATDDPALVLDALTLALRYRPDDPAIVRAAADSYNAADRPDKAYGLIRKIVLKTKAPDDARRMLEYAGYTGKAEPVTQAVATVRRLFPDSLQLTELAGEVSLWTRPPAQAYPLFRRAVELTGRDKARIMRMIEVASFSGKASLFRDAVFLARELRPEDRELAFYAAEIHASEGDKVKLADLMRVFAKNIRHNRALLEKWAVYAESAGLNEEAYHLFSQLFEDHPDSSKYRDAKIRLAEYTDRPDVAASLLAPQSDASPRNFDLAMRTGRAFLGAGLPPEALRYFRRAAGIRPADEDAALAMLEAQAAGGDFAKAIEYYETLARKRQLTEEERIFLAEAHVNAGQPERALNLLAEYADATDSQPRGALVLARAMALTGKGRKARRLFRQLARAQANNAEFLILAGSESLYLGMAEIAADMFDRALRLVPGDIRAMKGMAIAYADYGQEHRAERAFRSYLKKYPGDADAHLRLAELYGRIGKPSLALRQSKTAERLLAEQKRATQFRKP